MAKWPFVKEEDMQEDLQSLLNLSKERGAPKKDLYKILAHSPEMMRGFGNFWNAAFFDGVLEHPLKEVVRLRIAFHYGCPF